MPNVKFTGTWSLSSKGTTIPVEERFVKLRSPVYPDQNFRGLDRVEARSAWFTELQSYWSIPISDAGSIAGIAVSKGSKGDGTDDKIHVITMNPTSVYSMTPESEVAQEILIQSLTSSTRGMVPRYTMAPDNYGNLLIHEGTVKLRQNKNKSELKF